MGHVPEGKIGEADELTAAMRSVCGDRCLSSDFVAQEGKFHDVHRFGGLPNASFGP